MLSVNPETICFLIDKAHEFHAKEGVVIPEIPNSPADDWGRQVLADHLDDFSYREMTYVIDELEPDQRFEVMALMWLGRGDYEVDEWEDAVQDAMDGWSPQTVANLIATPLLADYLSEGLNLLEYSCGD